MVQCARHEIPNSLIASCLACTTSLVENSIYKIQLLLYLCINADERCLIFMNLAFSFSLSRIPIKDKKVVSHTENERSSPRNIGYAVRLKLKILTYCAVSRNDHFNVQCRSLLHPKMTAKQTNSQNTA